jgi:hypothetical protein
MLPSSRTRPSAPSGLSLVGFYLWALGYHVQGGSWAGHHRPANAPEAAKTLRPMPVQTGPCFSVVALGPLEEGWPRSLWQSRELRVWQDAQGEPKQLVVVGVVTETRQFHE